MNGAETVQKTAVTLDVIAGETGTIKDRLSTIAGRLIGTMGRLYGALPEPKDSEAPLPSPGLLNAISENLSTSRSLLSTIEQTLEELEAATQ